MKFWEKEEIEWESGRKFDLTAIFKNLWICTIDFMTLVLCLFLIKVALMWMMNLQWDLGNLLIINCELFFKANGIPKKSNCVFPA